MQIPYPRISLLTHVFHCLVLRFGRYMVEMGYLASMETAKTFLSSLRCCENAEALRDSFCRPKIRSGWTQDCLRVI